MSQSNWSGSRAQSLAIKELLFKTQDTLETRTSPCRLHRLNLACRHGKDKELKPIEITKLIETRASQAACSFAPSLRLKTAARIGCVQPLSANIGCTRSMCRRNAPIHSMELLSNLVDKKDSGICGDEPQRPRCYPTAKICPAALQQGHQGAWPALLCP